MSPPLSELNLRLGASAREREPITESDENLKQNRRDLLICDYGIQRCVRSERRDIKRPCFRVMTLAVASIYAASWLSAGSKSHAT